MKLNFFNKYGYILKENISCTDKSWNLYVNSEGLFLTVTYELHIFG